MAPFGDVKDIAHDLKYNIFRNDVGRYFRIKQGSDTMQIRYFHGADAVAKSKDPKHDPAVELQQNH